MEQKPYTCNSISSNLLFSLLKTGIWQSQTHNIYPNFCRSCHRFQTWSASGCSLSLRVNAKHNAENTVVDSHRKKTISPKFLTPVLLSFLLVQFQVTRALPKECIAVLFCFHLNMNFQVSIWFCLGKDRCQNLTQKSSFLSAQFLRIHRLVKPKQENQSRNKATGTKKKKRGTTSQLDRKEKNFHKTRHPPKKENKI